MSNFCILLEILCLINFKLIIIRWNENSWKYLNSHSACNNQGSNQQKYLINRLPGGYLPTGAQWNNNLGSLSLGITEYKYKRNNRISYINKDIFKLIFTVNQLTPG